MTSQASAAVSPSKDELALAARWTKERICGPVEKLPFSFVYDGKPCLLTQWKIAFTSEKVDKARTRTTITYTDPKTGLEVRWVAVEYADFPTVEWTLYFRNTGRADTPIISDVRALDTSFPATSEATLHHNTGTLVKANDFEPLTTALHPGQKIGFVPPGGRPCGTVWPCFNLQTAGGGVIVVVGWPGQWSAEFERDGDGVRVRGGQELVHLKLHPGEEIRTPLMVLQFYKGDWLRSQNIWRRWMLAHNLPRPGGKLPPPQLNACSSHQFAEMINANEENQKLFVDRYLEEDLKLDYWWMDAGWYPNEQGWPQTGTWEVDTKRFPRGLRAITDHAHAKGVRIIVWFEPERVRPNTWLWDTHPEWLLGSGDSRLLDLGNAEARNWLTEHVDRLITEQGIDLYRQDYNINPLPMWRETDTPDRQGFTENAYVTGYLAYWDELRRRHPNMLIDTCASGGHRNDLETLRRSVPLLRSDHIFNPVGQQGHTYGLAFWVPFFGTGDIEQSFYRLRSSMCASFTACWDVREKGLNYDLLRRQVSQWRNYAPNFLGDFYPLTPYTLSESDWIAWQFDRPEPGNGMVQAFRRAECPTESVTLKLQGLEAGASYTLTNLDDPKPVKVTGLELMEKGLTLKTAEKPAALIVLYKTR